ncbi:hypothetical protein IJ182_05545 [bacterium]|nr:hypothetical protein [bacterium]
MARIMTTNHWVVKLFGFKIIDVWGDYLERHIQNDCDIIMPEENIDEKESDN